jgi:diacylglycerol kinase (ATP)
MPPALQNIAIFANPLSGRGRGLLMAARVADTLTVHGCEVHTTTDPVETLDRFAADAIIVIGGDGTLRGVVEHLGKLVGLSNLPPILPIGLGTANLMQRHLGLKYHAGTMGDDALRFLRAGKTRLIDAGIVNERLFLLMAGCGFDAAVVRTVANERTGPIRKWTYVKPALTELLTANFPPLTVEVDGTRILSDRPAQVLVGNVSEYGTGFPIVPDADSGDGLLDICVLPCESVLELMLWQADVVRKIHTLRRDAIYLHGRNVKISGKTSMPLQIDGDAAGTTPADIRLLDEKVRFIVA